jgi:cell division transport system permease protein
MDVTAFFKEGVVEQDILNVKDEILKLSPEIKEVQYVSKEEALRNFSERHKDDPDFAKALEEVGVNPFLPSLNIVTDQPLQYEKVSTFLETGPFSQLIKKVDYSQKRETIERFFNITSNINRFGIILAAVLFLIAILVVLNTIRLSIDNSRDEITAMKLVGASNWFIRGPFIIQGVLCGLIAFLICLIISGTVIYLLSPKLEILVSGFSIFGYFLKNIGIISLIQLGFGTGLGVLASFIIVRGYLKV